MTPDAEVNRGVLWAKANMLRTELRAPTGWSFVNDPTRSNNSVGRDTAWFAFGADYLTPDFARASLLAYVERQEPSGMIAEYYDVRTGKTEDYGLNVNDNTPLLILALWHHYNTTGDRPFLERVYPAALKAARYLLSQRDERGLVWCTSKKTQDWGIVGWRNVIDNYRLSGATTELNSECFAALQTIGHMARVLENHDASAEFAQAAAELREAINTHLRNPDNGLYYLNIDVDGQPRTDLTADLVFPVMFGVADDDTAARIISRLSSEDFWTTAGIRTVPRDAPEYGPTHGYGLLGGVWVGVTFWYAFAAARFNAAFMAYALGTSFRHYSRDPRRNNTVPGQFSEWLHGETLVNQGMMLSPWFPPRYLWAAIEGAAGLDLSGGTPTVSPRARAGLEVARRAESAVSWRRADLVRRARARAAHVLELRVPPVVAVRRVQRRRQRIRANGGPRRRHAGAAAGQRSRPVRREHRRAHDRDGGARHRGRERVVRGCARSTACAARGSTKVRSRRKRSRPAFPCSSSAKGFGSRSCARKRELRLRRRGVRRAARRLRHVLFAAALVGRLGIRREIVRGVHEADVRERLRKVADEPLSFDVVLFREQAHVVGGADEPLEQRARVFAPFLQHVVVREPEAARVERAFAGREAVGVGVRLRVALDEAVDEQLALDRGNGTGDARIGRRQESRRAVSAASTRRSPGSRTIA